jgi:hypothetical protein
MVDAGGNAVLIQYISNIARMQRADIRSLPQQVGSCPPSLSCRNVFFYDLRNGARMKRVFAEPEDRETDSWGFECPCCRAYLTEDRPRSGSTKAYCTECEASFVVTFYDDQYASQ